MILLLKVLNSILSLTNLTKFNSSIIYGKEERFMKIHRGFKVRIYPNKNQEKELWKQIYGCRFVWNYLINLQ